MDFPLGLGTISLAACIRENGDFDAVRFYQMLQLETYFRRLHEKAEDSVKSHGREEVRKTIREEAATLDRRIRETIRNSLEDRIQMEDQVRQLTTAFHRKIQDALVQVDRQIEATVRGQLDRLTRDPHYTESNQALVATLTQAGQARYEHLIQIQTQHHQEQMAAFRREHEQLKTQLAEAAAFVTQAHHYHEADLRAIQQVNIEVNQLRYWNVGLAVGLTVLLGLVGYKWYSS